MCSIRVLCSHCVSKLSQIFFMLPIINSILFCSSVEYFSLWSKVFCNNFFPLPLSFFLIYNPIFPAICYHWEKHSFRNLPNGRNLLISLLQILSLWIFEPKNVNSVTISTNSQFVVANKFESLCIINKTKTNKGRRDIFCLFHYALDVSNDMSCIPASFDYTSGNFCSMNCWTMNCKTLSIILLGCSSFVRHFK